MNDQRKECYQLLCASQLSLEEKMDKLWELPEEELNNFLEQFTAEGNHEICDAIKKIREEKKLDKNSNPDEFQFVGLT